MRFDGSEYAEGAVNIREKSWSGAKVGVLGLGKSGRSAARLLARAGASVYASDISQVEELRTQSEDLVELGVDVELGRHDVGKLNACDVIVVSPGISPSASVLRDRGVASRPVISELELAFGFLDSPVVAVTGTNGKTTTAAWIGDMIGRSGLSVGVGGNIGEPLSDFASDRGVDYDWIVAEVSSFQLAHTVDFNPSIGVFLNLGVDHLDRYKTLDEYHADKARLFATATAESRWVLNGEDDGVLRLSASAPGTKCFFWVDSIPAPGEDGAWVAPEGSLTVRYEGVVVKMVRRDELRTLGVHNVANALAACLAAAYARIPMEAVRESLRGFEPLPHRLQPVAEVNGVLWINDSKATNVAASRMAVRALEQPAVLLLGGRGKGESFEALADDLADRVRAVIAYGEAADQIEAELRGWTKLERVEGPFEEVIERARQLAEPGDAVLLAPACASFDMFSDFEERGTRFVELVKERAS